MSEMATENTNWFSFGQKDMTVFIFVMSLSGLQYAITEVLPEFDVGPLELGVGDFIFIPIVLVLLFRTFWAALAVPMGEVVFEDILLGDFNGLGVMEDLLLVSTCFFFAALLFQDPKNRRQLAAVVLIAEGLNEFLAMFVDIGKVYIGVEELEAVPGLPESILVLEGVDFITQMVITGIIFGVIPALYLYPKLHGKIEPLMGMEPYKGTRGASMVRGFSWKAALSVLLAFPLAFGFAAAEEAGFGLNVVWEPEFMEAYGEMFIAVPIVVAALVAIVVWQRAKHSA
ncbi:hypothetical protein ATJ93_3708 [Halopiger aswanensis]|uniref:DUF8171 domain-containing protein n=2 Tax=Halopiger aswanensis TaxID=148449 RepID=A0A3R7GFI8_9EURY|nr:hypothetical protein ATJ93_3708 [Halopiger aswanensis]